MCLVGNKQDMDAMKEREVSMETGETFAKVIFLQGSAFLIGFYLHTGRFMEQISSKQVPRQVTM